MPDTGPNEHMMPMNVAPGMNVRPSRVVKLSALADFAVQEAIAADMPFGISQNWTKKGAPGTPYDDGFVSTEEDPSVMVWGPGSIAVAAIKSNAPAINPGSSVGANASSEIVAVTTGNAVGWLLEGGDASKSQRLRIFVHPHYKAGGS